MGLSNHKKCNERCERAVKEAYQQGRKDAIKQMLQDAQDNEEAGHKWSRGDFLKWAEYEMGDCE